MRHYVAPIRVAVVGPQLRTPTVRLQWPTVPTAAMRPFLFVNARPYKDCKLLTLFCNTVHHCVAPIRGLFVQEPADGAFGRFFEFLGHYLDFLYLLVGPDEFVEALAVALHRFFESGLVEAVAFHLVAVGMA